jgi:hypothetical protein
MVFQDQYGISTPACLKEIYGDGIIWQDNPVESCRSPFLSFYVYWGGIAKFRKFFPTEMFDRSSG